MKYPRNLTEEEKVFIMALLCHHPSTRNYADRLDSIQVLEMEDGGMGSLQFLAGGGFAIARTFGRQIATGLFVDADGVTVSATVNVDSNDALYELDMWKVNFAPLVKWPHPAAISFVD